MRARLRRGLLEPPCSLGMDVQSFRLCTVRASAAVCCSDSGEQRSSVPQQRLQLVRRRSTACVAEEESVGRECERIRVVATVAEQLGKALQGRAQSNATHRNLRQQPSLDCEGGWNVRAASERKERRQQERCEGGERGAVARMQQAKCVRERQRGPRRIATAERSNRALSTATPSLSLPSPRAIVPRQLPNCARRGHFSSVAKVGSSGHSFLFPLKTPFAHYCPVAVLIALSAHRFEKESGRRLAWGGVPQRQEQEQKRRKGKKRKKRKKRKKKSPLQGESSAAEFA